MKIKPLKGHEAFATVFHRGERFVSGPIRCVLRRKVSADSMGLAVGVAVAKKRVPRAVDRNRIKRLLREASRHVLRTIEDEVMDSGITEMVFIWQRSSSMASMISLRDVEPHVRSILSSASNVNQHQGDDQ